MKDNLVIYVGNVCNNDCRMCSVESMANDPVDYKELLKKIRTRKSEFKSISFTGGEPTEHPQILKLIQKSKELGYKEIGLSSNGRNFASQKFTEKVIDSGLNTINISIHGVAEVHDKIVGHKGAYKEIISGIENILSNPKFNNNKISIDSVLLKQNEESLPRLWKTLLSMKINSLSIADFILEESVDVDFSKFALPYTDKKGFIYKNLKLLRKFSFVTYANFVRCSLPPKLPDGSGYISYYKKENDWTIDGLQGSSVKNFHKKLPVCKKCTHQNKCYGFKKKYLDKYGEKDALKMLGMDNFLKKA